MNLFRQLLGSLKWVDVVEFCAERESEGATLDYKEDIPKDIEKTVSAMANTLGGIIILGVSEDDQAKPLLPILGMDMRRGLVEQITSKCVDNIYPPVVPESYLVSNETGDKALVVLRIAQSRDAPHAINSSTRVYIRTGRQNSQDALASLDRIFWLRERRQQSEAFGEWLFARANERYDLIQAGKVHGIAASTEPERGHCLLTLAVSPVYPDASTLVRSSDLNQIRRKITIRDPMRTADEFPIQERETVNRIVEDGVVMHWPGGRSLRTYHTHLNIHGLYFYKQSLLFLPSPEHRSAGSNQFMRFSEIVDRAYSVLLSGKKFYNEIGYHGPLSVRLKLENIIGFPMLLGGLTNNDEETFIRYSADPLVQALTFTDTRSLIVDRSTIVEALARRVAWAYDSDFTSQMAESYAASRFREAIASEGRGG
jgi:hypothetical protein